MKKHDTRPRISLTNPVLEPASAAPFSLAEYPDYNVLNGKIALWAVTPFGCNNPVGGGGFDRQRIHCSCSKLSTPPSVKD
jgi:hypothetical protein